jgi:hypothetical protein
MSWKQAAWLNVPAADRAHLVALAHDSGDTANRPEAVKRPAAVADAGARHRPLADSWATRKCCVDVL